MKKVFSLLTSLIMVISLAGVMPTMSVGAAGGVKAKLDSFISTYPNGDQWTGTFDGGTQCYGFAKLAIYNIFGKYNGTYRTWKYDGTPTVGMTKIDSITSYSSSNVKSLLSNAKCGDVLQFNTTKQHTMIVYSVDSDGVVIYDCNSDYNCGIRLKKVSFGAWSGRNSSKLTLLRANNYSDVDGVHTHNYTGDRVYEIDHPHVITQRCTDYSSCGGYKVTGEYAQVKSCKQCWYATFDVSASSVSLKVGESKSISATINGFFPDTMFGVLDYDTSRIEVTTGQNIINFKGLKAGTCTLKLIIYSDNTKSYVIGSKSISVTVSAPTYNITYNANGGSNAPSSQTKVHGQDLSLSSSIPTGKTYTVTFNGNGGVVTTSSKNYTQSFKEWNTKADGTGTAYSPSDTYSTNASTTLYAQWSTPLLKIENPTKTNYYFAGWYDSTKTDSNGNPIGKRYTTDTPITSNITLYAMWNTNLNMDVFFGDYNLDGIINTSDILGINKMRTGAISYTDEDVFRCDVNADGTITLEDIDMLNEVRVEIIDIYAMPCYLYYDGLTIKTLPDKTTYQYGEDLNVSGLVLEAQYSNGTTHTLSSGYIITGYDPYAIGTQRLTVNYYFDSTDLNVTVNAPTYTITYNANGGTVASNAKTVTYGKAIGTLPTPTREGYIFLGWSYSQSGSTYVKSSTTYSYMSNKTLYAQWLQICYTVKYNANGGTNAPSSQTKTYGKSLMLSNTIPTRDGYNFLGWSTSSAATSATYSAGGSYTNNTSATLYAVWKANTYTVSYNANGGSGAPSSQIKTYGKNLTLASTKPTRAGCTFLGWSTSSTATSATYSAGGSYTDNASVTLYAVWSKNHTHSYTTTITKQATCTQSGISTSKCSCGSSYTSTISALGHSYSSSWTVDKEATCISTGSKSHHCTHCGAKSTITSIPMTAHKYVDTIIDSTCLADGYIAHTCSVCGDTYTDNVVKAIGHKYATTVVKPTYTAEGYTLHKCTVCGNSYKDNITAKLVTPNVTGFKVTATSAQAVRLSWNKVTGADGYIIEQYKSGKWTRVAKLTNKNTTVYSVKKLASGTTYKFRMKAYKMSGGKAYYSGYTSTLTTCTKPATPKAKMVLNSSVSVRLSWNKITGAGGYIVEQYKNGSWVRVAKVAGTSTVQYSVKGLASGTTYKFRVKAYKMLGSKAYYSSYSSTVTTCTKPATVKFTLTAGTNKATVKWNKVTGASGYIVYYRTSPSKGWTRLTKVGASTTSYTKTGLTGGKTYYFTVKAYKFLGSTPYYGGVTSKSVKPGMTESELKNKITSKYGKIGSWAYADYDGNGTKEAYAVIGYKDSIANPDAPPVYVYFINSKGEITRMKSRRWGEFSWSHYYDNAKIFKQGNRRFFSFTTGEEAPSTGFILGVVNGKPYEFNASTKYREFTCKGEQIYAEKISSNSNGLITIRYNIIYDETVHEFRITTPSWETAYINYIAEINSYSYDPFVAEYYFVNINNDNIPEIFYDSGSGAGGSELITYNNGKVVSLHMGNSSYIEFYEKQNLFKYSGGHMDSYYDKIYTIKNGKFTLLHDGDYGAEDNSHIELDKYGNPIYRYYWNSVEVTKTKYNSLLNSVFDSSKAISVYSKKGYAWNQIRDAINNY